MWAPWRLKYVAEEKGETGCVFCSRLASNNDTKSLILRRSDHAFVIMNLYPYNTGHVMIVPNRHVADPEELTSEELSDFSSLLPETLAILRRVLRPAGFNIGMNVGAIAGAGVADHLHQHIVPRWQGDANFMPIIAGTMVLPELIPATYAKVRAEIEHSRHVNSADLVAVVILSRDATKVLVAGDKALPTISVKPHQPVFQTATDYLRSLGLAADLAGWAGDPLTATTSRVALAFLASSTPQMSKMGKWRPTTDAIERLPEEDRATLRHALDLDLTITVAPPV
jgi:ATP adenylyltransferase